MLASSYKALRMGGRLYHSYISTVKIHSTCVACGGHQVLPPLNEAEESRIVDIVNKSTIEELEAFEINSSHMKKLRAFREKKGKFETFNDILMSQELPLVINLCRSILTGEKQSRKRKLSGERKSIVTPPLDVLSKKSIKTVLAIRVWANRISWAKIDECRNLCAWESTTWENPSKSTPVPLVDTIIDIMSQLPDANAYLMESDPHTNLGKLNAASHAFHLQRQQVISIIISVLRMKQLTINGEHGTENNFYMMQAHAAAKKFNLRVGSETVSADSIVEDILMNKPNSDSKTQLSIKPENLLRYQSYERDTREHLNAVLLVAMTFKELVNNEEVVKP